MGTVKSKVVIVKSSPSKPKVKAMIPVYELETSKCNKCRKIIEPKNLRMEHIIIFLRFGDSYPSRSPIHLGVLSMYSR